MKYQIHTDGGSRGNPGPAAIGIVIEAESGPVHSLGKTIGTATNNVAEYTAVLEALEYLKSTSLSNVESISFFLDSLLVVEQLKGRYKMKNAGLLPLFTKIQSLRTSLAIPITFSHVPREQNAEADSLVNQALDGTISS